MRVNVPLIPEWEIKQRILAGVEHSFCMRGPRRENREREREYNVKKERKKKLGNVKLFFFFFLLDGETT